MRKRGRRLLLLAIFLNHCGWVFDRVSIVKSDMSYSSDIS